MFDPLQLTAFFCIAIVFIFALKGINSEDKGFFTAVSAHAPSLLTSLGIFFTFLGIFIALQSFNTEADRIDESIPSLLAGLKVAFLSSVVGLFGAITFRLLKPLFAKELASDEVTASDLVDELRKIGKGTESVKDALVGDGDASLSTQLIKLRTDFRDFAEKVSEDGSQALIKALEEVIADFNTKINEQFGENFKQLNEAVAALLDWQKEYKEQVKLLTEAFQESQRGIEAVKVSVEGIEKSTSTIPPQMEKIEDIFQKTDNRMEELHKGLGTLADMRTQAESALPKIEEKMLSMTEGFQTAINKQVADFNENFENQQSNFNKTNEKFNGVLDSLNMASDNLLDSTKQIVKELEESVTTFRTEQTNMAREMQGKLTSSADEVGNLMTNSLKELDSQMGSQLQNSLDLLGSNLTAITQKFVDVYEPFANRIQTVMNKLDERERT